MQPEDEEITPVAMAYCPATAQEDCPAGDMRCVGGSCRKLREQQATKLASDLTGAEAADWIERTRATVAERAKAAEVGKGVCPACGDWLPLDLDEFRCMGKGNHVAVSRDSVFPPKPTKPSPSPSADMDHAVRNALLTALALIFVFVLALVLGQLTRDTPPPPPAREGAS